MAAPDLAQLALDSLPGRILVLGSDRRILLANQPLLDFLNQRTEAVIGQPASAVLGASLATTLEPFLRGGFAGMRGEWEGWARIGPLLPRYLRQTVLPMRGADGAVTALLVQMEEPPPPSDLPPRGKHEREIDTVPVDAALLLALLEESPIRTCVIDRGERYVYCNRAYAANFRCTPEEIIGRSLQEVLSEPLYRMVSAWVPNLDAGQTVRNEGWYTYPNGMRGCTQQWVVPYIDADRNVVAGLSMSHDQTMLRMREMEVAEQAAALRASEATYGAVLASALDGVIVFDAGGRVVEFNPAAEAVFGLTRETALDRDVGDMLVDLDGAAIAADGAGLLGQRMEVTARRADGTVFPCELAVTEVALPTRRLFTAHARDLTQARATAAEIERQRGRLHQIEKLSAMGSLLAGVAHELNNPLAILLTQASLLKETARDEAVKKRAERIEAAATRSGRIVKSFLAMARQKPAQREPISLNELVEAALEMTAYGLRSAGIEVTRRFDGALPWLEADRDLLGQVAANLIINAQQALAERPPPRRITLRTHREGDHAVLEVEDNGPGVPASARERIFEPYFTTKAVGVGTGIGLSICRQVAEEHGGSIALHDAPGGGALFRLTLPLPAGAARDAPAEIVPAAGVEALAILVIDDEVDVGQSLVDTLEHLGHPATLVAGPEAALARIEAGARCDLIIADLRMPTMNGMELHAAIAARRPELARRFVVMTGDVVAGPGLVERDSAAAPPTLEKPFNPAEVRALLERLSAEGRL